MGEIVYVGEGSKSDFEALEKLGVNFEDKIVVVKSIAPFTMIHLCEERNVAGIIVVTDPPRNLIRTLTARLYPPPSKPPFKEHVTGFPGVIISARDGERLLNLLNIGRVKIRLSQEGEYFIQRTANIVGVVWGAEKSEEQVIVGAHYDTQLAGCTASDRDYLTPFAWDNGTGVASMLKMARLTSLFHPRRTCKFIGFAAEESGLWGSTFYAHIHKEELRSCVGMVNLDAVSSIYPAENAVWSTTNIKSLVCRNAEKVGWKIDYTVDPKDFLFSDYVPFMKMGIPAMWVWEYPPIHPYYHSERDILDYIDMGKLAKTAIVSKICAFELANTPNLKDAFE